MKLFGLLVKAVLIIIMRKRKVFVGKAAFIYDRIE